MTIRITSYGNSNIDLGKYNISPSTVTLTNGTIVEVTAICTGCREKRCYINLDKKHIPYEEVIKNSWEGNKNKSPVGAVMMVNCPPKMDIEHIVSNAA